MAPDRCRRPRHFDGRRGDDTMPCGVRVDDVSRDRFSSVHKDAATATRFGVFFIHRHRARAAGDVLGAVVAAILHWTRAGFAAAE